MYIALNANSHCNGWERKLFMALKFVFHGLLKQELPFYSTVAELDLALATMPLYSV